MDRKVINRKRKSDEIPLCKYGISCYQKNPEHHKKFRHPPAQNVIEMKDVNKNSLNDAPKVKCPVKPKDEDAVGSVEVTNVKDVNENSLDDTLKLKSPAKPKDKDAVDSVEVINVSDSEVEFIDGGNSEIVKNILKTMPKDFFDFWSFCSSLNKSHPEDAFSDLGIQLVGVYDLLAKKLPPDQRVDISCHWRFYYDPPEFQTVIQKNGDNLYHIGYFRDDPSEMPAILASNKANVDSKLTLEGDNIFAAMISALEEVVNCTKSKDLKVKAKKVQDKIEKFASEKKYSVEVQTNKTKERQKKVVAKTFHGLGIVVPFKNDIGYRPLPDSNATMKTMLKKIVSCKDEAKRLELEEQLDEVISNVHFANDECDFGMGLEFGIDLFCYGDPYLHEQILGLLPLAYNLLQRPKYASIVQAHLKNRRKGTDLSTL